MALDARPARWLVVGWFSFEEVVATVGDLLVKDVACRWLEEAGADYDVALAPFVEGDGLDWRRADPRDYGSVLWACGPVGERPLIRALLERFSHCRVVGVDVSLLDAHLREGFDVLLERDFGGSAAQPDLAFATDQPLIPVVGVGLTHHQDEYPQGVHAAAAGAVERLLDSRDLAVVDVDTDLLAARRRGLSPAGLESLLARTDAVVTTRLHVLVLALKHGIPAVAIDPVEGGAKVMAQAHAVDWPAALPGERLTDEALDGALDWCLTGEARRRAESSRTLAAARLRELRARFMAAVAG